MVTKSLTYSELAAVWGISKDAARKKVEGLRLPRTRGNDGLARVTIDLEEVTHTPKSSARRPHGDQEEADAGDQEETGRPPSMEVQALQDRVTELRADLERERAEARENLDRERAERLRERDRADQLTGELADHNRRLTALLEEIRELAAIRERLAVSELRSTESHERHVAELRDLRARLEGDAGRVREELTAFRALPWWRRLVG